jgi:hypothetical protein
VRVPCAIPNVKPQRRGWGITFGAAEENLLKLLGYIIDNPLELAAPQHTDLLQRSEKNTVIIY